MTLLCPCGRWALVVETGASTEAVQAEVRAHMTDCVVLQASSITVQGEPASA